MQLCVDQVLPQMCVCVCVCVCVRETVCVRVRLCGGLKMTFIRKALHSHSRGNYIYIHGKKYKDGKRERMGWRKTERDRDRQRQRDKDGLSAPQLHITAASRIGSSHCHRLSHQ